MSRFKTGVSYVGFHSVYMNGMVTVGLDSEEGFLADVRVGEQDIGLWEHLEQHTKDKLEEEAQAAVEVQRREYA